MFRTHTQHDLCSTVTDEEGKCLVPCCYVCIYSKDTEDECGTSYMGCGVVPHPDLFHDSDGVRDSYVMFVMS